MQPSDVINRVPPDRGKLVTVWSLCTALKWGASYRIKQLFSPIIWPFVAARCYAIDIEWNINRNLHVLYLRVLFRMTLSDLEWLGEIFSDTNYRAVSRRQLSFLSVETINFFFAKFQLYRCGRFDYTTKTVKSWYFAFLLRNLPIRGIHLGSFYRFL